MIPNFLLVDPYPLFSITTGNQRTNRPASHLAFPKHYGLVWQSNGSANLWVKGNFGTAKMVDFIGVMCANAQPGTLMRIKLGMTEAQVDGAALWDTGVIPFSATPAFVSADGLYHSHQQIGIPVQALWFRIEFGGHAGDFQASSFIFGKSVTTERYYDFSYEIGAEDLGGISWSADGVATEEDGVIHRTKSFQLAWTSEQEMREKLLPIVHSPDGARKFIWCCFNPEPTIYRQQNTFMGWLRQSPTFQASRKPGKFISTLTIRSGLPGWLLAP